MKMRTILASVLMALVLLSCSKEDAESNVTGGDPADVAYLSLKIGANNLTKGSSEDPGSGESVVNSLYIVTFDATNNVLKIPDKPEYFLGISTGATLTPEAFRIAADAKGLLVVLNPGNELKKVITNLGPGSTFTTLNKEIKNINLTELSGSNGFAMINAGDDSGAGPISIPLVTLNAGQIKKVSAYPSEAAAKAAAEASTVEVLVERLASKLELALKTTVEVLPTGATFSLIGWTVDALNTVYYPYAEKTLLSTTPVGSIYKKNFYTKDPNFTGKVGLTYTKIEDFKPTLIHPDGWKSNATIAYTVENTMDASEQKYENATRLVIKGTYCPDPTWTAGEDWFSFANETYKDLAVLKAAYTAAGPGNLQNACDDMFDQIEYYLTTYKPSYTMDGTDFLSLSTDDLDAIPENLGGEVVKTSGTNSSCIRWYQGGQSYYYYEIRHDNDANDQMAFGKYGVVRNNWYSLTLGKVNGAGTPWYPDINNPGPGDPDPTDNIDEDAGYLGIEVKIAPWIIWKNEIVI